MTITPPIKPRETSVGAADHMSCCVDGREGGVIKQSLLTLIDAL